MAYKYSPKVRLKAKLNYVDGLTDPENATKLGLFFRTGINAGAPKAKLIREWRNASKGTDNDWEVAKQEKNKIDLARYNEVRTQFEVSRLEEKLKEQKEFDRRHVGALKHLEAVVLKQFDHPRDEHGKYLLDDEGQPLPPEPNRNLLDCIKKGVDAYSKLSELHQKHIALQELDKSITKAINGDVTINNITNNTYESALDDLWKEGDQREQEMENIISFNNRKHA